MFCTCITFLAPLFSTIPVSTPVPVFAKERAMYLNNGCYNDSVTEKMANTKTAVDKARFAVVTLVSCMGLFV